MTSNYNNYRNESTPQSHTDDHRKWQMKSEIWLRFSIFSNQFRINICSALRLYSAQLSHMRANEWNTPQHKGDWGFYTNYDILLNKMKINSIGLGWFGLGWAGLGWDCVTADSTAMHGLGGLGEGKAHQVECVYNKLIYGLSIWGEENRKILKRMVKQFPIKKKAQTHTHTHMWVRRNFSPFWS